MKQHLSITLTQAKAELSANINVLKERYNLPYYLLEEVVNDCLLEIKSATQLEIMRAMQQAEDGEGVTQ